MTGRLARPVLDAVVVGGGPAGSSTAFALAQAGARVLVLDRARFPRSKPCAECVSPQAARILAKMGVLQDVDAEARPIAGMLVRAPGGAEIRGDFLGAGRFAGSRDRGIAIRRESLDPLLLARAAHAGAEVREGMRVRSVLRDDAGAATGVRVTDEHGRASEIHARLVIGADGLRSVVSSDLGLAGRLAWPRRIAFVSHWQGVRDVSDWCEMHVERDGFVGIADVGGCTNASLVLPASAVKRWSSGRFGGGAEGVFRSWIAAHPHLAARFAGATLTEPMRAVGPFAVSAKRAWAPGALLVGDAADFFDPFTGEGVYCALRGGEMAGAAGLSFLGASDSRSAQRALAAYDAARRREFGGKWWVERLIGAAVAIPAVMNRAATTLSRRRDMADLLIGVTGDFVPASEVLNAKFLSTLFLRPGLR
ncbi:MAG: monooxygenase FAD-binding protein [Gemmatimonadetes bacterium]|nr:monooxygenase FAD-binding protein [Gemmatimonadota bacterium]